MKHWKAYSKFYTKRKRPIGNAKITNLNGIGLLCRLLRQSGDRPVFYISNESYALLRAWCNEREYRYERERAYDDRYALRLCQKWYWQRHPPERENNTRS